MEMSIPFAYSSSIGALSSKFSSTSVTSAGEEGRRDGDGDGDGDVNGNGNGNGNRILNPTPHPQHPSSQVHHHYSPKQTPDPNPDQHPSAALIPTKTPTSKVSPISVRYKECLKNHAANIGGHVVDGCGEFMPSGEEALKCAACDCHRNFHRKVVDGVPHIQLLHSKSIVLSPPPVHQKYPTSLHASPHPQSLPIMSSGATESSSEDHDVLPTPPPFLQPKKRFRTKFSQEQKEKMMEFAEKVGWRIQRHEEHVLERFCDEVGVKRNVLKVWMHNNKQAMKRKHFQDENALRGVADKLRGVAEEVDYKTDVPV